MQNTPYGTRECRRTGQFIPQINGKDISPTSFDEERAMQIARETFHQMNANP